MDAPHPGGRRRSTGRGAAAGTALLVRLSLDERAALDVAAVAAGQTTAAWVRDLAVAAAQTQKKPARR